MKAKIVLTLSVLGVIAVPMIAQSAFQRELSLDALQSSQMTALPELVELLPPAVRSGNTIYLGYREPESPGSMACFEWYFIQADDAIPETATDFISVVVASGGQRGYLWRSGQKPIGDCP